MTSAWGEHPEEAADSADEDGPADEDPYASESREPAPEPAIPVASPQRSDSETIASLEWQIDILVSPGFNLYNLL